MQSKKRELGNQAKVMICLTITNNPAVLCIQRIWRGYKVRMQMKSLLAEHKYKRNFGATIIQKVWKGFRVRKQFKAILEMCKYEDDDDFEYSGILHCHSFTTVGVDENLFILPDDDFEQFNFPSSFLIHNSKLWPKENLSAIFQ